MKLLIKMIFALFILANLIPLEPLASVNNPAQKLVASLSEPRIKLWATEKEGNLTNFNLQLEEDTLSFPSWVNVVNPTYSPQLYFNSIEEGQGDNIVIILTTGYGSEVMIQDVHVLHKENKKFVEKKVEDLISSINKNVRSTLTKSDVTIDVQNKKTTVNLDKYGIEPSHLFSKVAFGSVTKYKFINKQLVAIVGATISPSGGYIGELYISYAFKDNKYQVSKMQFVPSN
ncbi:hypothetical protein ACQCVH_24290 [Bacillus infantis]|uniref:hypothetical protein n=1 Tax=Bacillus infantis TaxID=324767 RepID=UPI003CEA561F